jgi:ATP-dependent DNA helicase RecG
LDTRPGTDEERREILSRKEDQFLDFKSKRIAPGKLQAHFVALANTDGGEVFVGIEDESVPASKRIDGYSKPEEANDVLHHFLERTSPRVPDVEVEFIDFGLVGLVLHIDVPKSPKVHYTSSNECFVRVNASTRRIAGDKITQLGYAKGAYSYERAVIEDLDAHDLIDGEKIALYLQRIGSQQHPKTFLMKQKVVKEIQGRYRPTVAGVLLFDEEPQASLDTKCAIKVYRLQTTQSKYKREYLEADPITIEGELESQINQVLKVVEQTLAGGYVQAGRCLGEAEISGRGAQGDPG